MVDRETFEKQALFLHNKMIDALYEICCAYEGSTPLDASEVHFSDKDIEMNETTNEELLDVIAGLRHEVDILGRDKEVLLGSFLNECNARDREIEELKTTHTNFVELSERLYGDLRKLNDAKCRQIETLSNNDIDNRRAMREASKLLEQ